MRWERRIPTPRDDYDATLDALAALVSEGETAAGETCTVGIGMPGAISPATGLVKNANSTWLNGRPLQEDLERRLARPVRLANDANCLAVSEATDGAAAGARVVFGVILGTGTGGGHRDRRAGPHGRQRDRRRVGPQPAAVADRRGAAGPPCYCGRHGCIETFLSGPALAAAYRRAPRWTCAQKKSSRAPRRRTRSPRRARRMASTARARLATVINVLDPDVIVVGGGLSNISRIYADVPQRWGPACSPIGSRPGSCRRNSATPAASAARPGCGPCYSDLKECLLQLSAA